MAGLSIGKAWEESVAFVRREGQLLFPVALLFLAVPFAVILQMIPADYMHIEPGQTASLPTLPLSVKLGLAAAIVIGFVGTLTLYALALKPGISVGEALRLGVRRLPVLAGAMALVVIAYLFAVVVLSLLAGMLALAIGSAVAVTLALVILIPALIFVATRLVLINAVVVDRPVSAIDGLKQAWALTASQIWRLIFFMAVLVLLGTVAQMAVQILFGVIGGLLGGADAARAASDIAVAAATAVIQLYFLVMIARIYRQLEGGA